MQFLKLLTIGGFLEPPIYIANIKNLGQYHYHDITIIFFKYVVNNLIDSHFVLSSLGHNVQSYATRQYHLFKEVF